jgi:sugar lactone lactonase YvrE
MFQGMPANTYLSAKDINEIKSAIETLEENQEPVDTSGKLDRGGYSGNAQNIVDLIPEFEPGQNIKIVDDVIDVDIPAIETQVTVLATTGNGPSATIIDSLGNVYTANRFSDNVTKITPSGVSSILGTTGIEPIDITIDLEGNVYTANYGSNNVTKITPSGVSSILGTTGSFPISIDLDVNGNVYTGNSGSNNVTKITPSGVSSILGTTGSFPISIVIDADGNVYTANIVSSNVTKITPAGVSSIFAAISDNIFSMAIDLTGNIYIGTSGGSVNVWKITPSGSASVLVALFDGQESIAVDEIGNVYVATFNYNYVTKITQDTARSLAVNESGKIIRVPSPYTKSETDSKDTAVITTLRDGVAEAGNTLQKLYNLLSGAGAEITVANIAARNALNISSIGTRVFVTDDGDGKWALYRASQTGVSSNYVKLSDPDLLNAVMSAEMIKTAYESNPDTNAFTNALKVAYDAVVSGFSGKANTSDISQNVEADKASTSKWYSAKSIYDWVTDKLALKANISSLPLTIANGVPSATVTASVPTLIESQPIGTLAGKNILRIVKLFHKVGAVNETINAELRLYDTVLMTETTIGFASSNSNSGHTAIGRHIAIDIAGGFLRVIDVNVGSNSDDIMIANQNVINIPIPNVNNPLLLRTYLRNGFTGSGMRQYSSLIQVF